MPNIGLLTNVVNGPGGFVIEDTNLVGRLPGGVPFTMCFDAGGTGLPCRVVAEIS